MTISHNYKYTSQLEVYPTITSIPHNYKYASQLQVCLIITSMPHNYTYTSQLQVVRYAKLFDKCVLKNVLRPYFTFYYVTVVVVEVTV